MDVILEFLMEATLVNLSFNHTSILPLFVAPNMKSLFTANNWMSNPVDNDPITPLFDRENTYQISQQFGNEKLYNVNKKKL